MSLVNVPIDESLWAAEAGYLDRTHVWGKRWLPAVASAALLAIDLLVVLAAFLLAYWVRFVVPDAEASAIGVENYQWMGLAVSIATSALLSVHGLYDQDRPLAWPGRLHAIIAAVSTALAIAVVLSFLFGVDRISRLWFAAGWSFAVLGLAVWRTIAISLYAAVRDAVAPANRVLIVGANPLAEQLAHELAEHYQVVGYVDNGSDFNGRTDLPLLGPIARLEQLVHAHAVDELVIALPSHRLEQVTRVIARGFRRRVKIKLDPHLGELMPKQFEVHDVGGRSYIGFASTAKVSWLKRITDLIIGTVAVLLLAPLMLAIAIAIKLDSPGPVLYRQRRVGLHGREFWILKFRSMSEGADRRLDTLRHANEVVGPIFKIKSDPRVTRVGRVLRRFSLDELPQLFNVVRGEMSLVGPRPPLPWEVEEYEDWHFGRLRTVPGITGLWQVSGRSEVPFHDMVRLDLHYIRNWSLALDIEILLRTVPAVFTGRGAY